MQYTKYLYTHPKNIKPDYSNWGLTPDGRPVCIDYDYIDWTDMRLFKCICGCKTMTFYDNTFEEYKCTLCGKKYTKSELIRMIAQKKRRPACIDFTDCVKLDDATHFAKFNENEEDFLNLPYETIILRINDLMDFDYNQTLIEDALYQLNLEMGKLKKQIAELSKYDGWKCMRCYREIRFRMRFLKIKLSKGE